MTIPKIIHQTWKTNEIPEKWQKSQIEWKKYHPDWDYILWTDEMNRELIISDYPTLLSLYDSYDFPIQRADMIRYCILKKYGGVYSDLDLFPSENIEKYISSDCDVYFVMSSNSKIFTNNFMISKPNAKIWDLVINNLTRKSKWYHVGKHLQVYNTTGPNFLNRNILEYPDTIGILPINKFHAYSIHEQDRDGSFINFKKDAILHPLPGRSWCSWDSNIYNFFYDHAYFFFTMGLLFCVLLISLVIILSINYSMVKLKYKNNNIFIK